jgi:hypothetical protein
MKMMLLAASVTALLAGSQAHAGTPNMLTSNASHSYECTIEKDEAPMPQGGKAHIVVNGQTQNVTVALRDMLDGDGKPVQGSSWVSPLFMHFEGAQKGAPEPDPNTLMIMWDPDAKGVARGLLIFVKDREPHLMLKTIIPFADWPAWIQKNANSVPYYGIFDCHEV